MISATILNIQQDGQSISLDYILIDDQDPNYSKQGVLPISIGWLQQDIVNQLTPILDAANYAVSLKPLLTVQIKSPNPAPSPVVTNLPPVHISPSIVVVP